MKSRRIVAAAHKLDDLILVGARHWDRVVRKQLKYINKYRETEFKPKDFKEGFIDNFGQFCTRKEAHKIAEIEYQILYRCGGDNETLCSDNLY